MADVLTISWWESRRTLRSGPLLWLLLIAPVAMAALHPLLLKQCKEPFATLGQAAVLLVASAGVAISRAVTDRTSGFAAGLSTTPVSPCAVALGRASSWVLVLSAQTALMLGLSRLTS